MLEERIIKLEMSNYVHKFTAKIVKLLDDYKMFVKLSALENLIFDSQIGINIVGRSFLVLE